MLKKSKILTEEDLQRIVREINILRKIRHPNLVQLYEVIEDSEVVWIVQEVVDGGELYDHIVQKGQLGEEEACHLFWQLVTAVEELGKHGISHRDIKPENILLDKNMNLKLIDFGLGRLFKKGELLSTACGSPCYAAPEMVARKKYDGTIVDIWSSGVTLFAMLCGHLPFDDNDLSNLYLKILKGEYEITSNISNEARDLLHNILQTDPSKRITLSKIKEHPWMKLRFLFCRQKESEINYNIINQAVIDKIVEAGVDRSLIEKGIADNEHNMITTIYYLLCKKNLTEEELEDFDLSLKDENGRLIFLSQENPVETEDEFIKIENRSPLKIEISKRKIDLKTKKEIRNYVESTLQKTKTSLQRTSKVNPKDYNYKGSYLTSQMKEKDKKSSKVIDKLFSRYKPNVPSIRELASSKRKGDSKKLTANTSRKLKTSVVNSLNYNTERAVPRRKHIKQHPIVSNARKIESMCESIKKSKIEYSKESLCNNSSRRLASKNIKLFERSSDRRTDLNKLGVSSKRRTGITTNRASLIERRVSQMKDSSLMSHNSRPVEPNSISFIADERNSIKKIEHASMNENSSGQRTGRGNSPRLNIYLKKPSILTRNFRKLLVSKVEIAKKEKKKSILGLDNRYRQNLFKSVDNVFEHSISNVLATKKGSSNLNKNRISLFGYKKTTPEMVFGKTRSILTERVSRGAKQVSKQSKNLRSTHKPHNSKVESTTITGPIALDFMFMKEDKSTATDSIKQSLVDVNVKVKSKANGSGFSCTKNGIRFYLDIIEMEKGSSVYGISTQYPKDFSSIASRIFTEVESNILSVI